ncbi:MAG TPA: antibiotic biosynthesis monooxygenase [Thermoanaerobaculia bacterium]|jgi:heme-degrading monooxygenase HmoA
MILILFRSRLTPAAGDDYVAMNERMQELAEKADGFVDVKAYTAADGERLTIVRWRDLESLRRWREDPRHRAAQEMGRERWYEYYVSEVAEVVRESRFARPAVAAEGAAEAAS